MINTFFDTHPWAIVVLVALIAFLVYHLGDVVEVLAQR